MIELIFLGVLFIALVVIITLILYIRLGKKRNDAIHQELKKVLAGINTVSSTVNNHEKSAISRDNSLRTLVSKSQQKLVSSIDQSADVSIGRIGCLVDRVVNEIQSSTNIIQGAIQYSHSGLSKSFKSKLNDLGSELTELHQDLRDFKDNILQTQAQSFSGIETRLGTIRSEEHRFIEHELQTIHKNNSTLDKSLQEICNGIKPHLDSIKAIEDLLSRLGTLYNKIMSLDKDILNQEKSLNAMVDKHLQIVGYTQELQKTSEEIFELMKLLLMDSVVKSTTPKK